jgi:hypothetical protein
LYLRIAFVAHGFASSPPGFSEPPGHVVELLILYFIIAGQRNARRSHQSSDMLGTVSFMVLTVCDCKVSHGA